MVASFMVALYLGSLANRAWRAESPNNLAPVEAIAVTPAPQAPLPGEPRTPETPQRADTPSSPWQMVTLGDAAGSGKSVRIPVVERDNLDESWSRKFPSAVPKEVLEKLRRNGLRVRQHRKLLPFRLKDGRRLVVPVDQLDVQYDKEPAL